MKELRPHLQNFIHVHADSIDACEFDFLFAVTASAGIANNELMEVLMLAGIEPLKYMIRIPAATFKHSTLTKIEIPGNIEVIGMNAFNGAEIEEISIPEGVESINGLAFANCKALRKVWLPSTLDSLGAGIFNQALNLEHIYYNGTRDQWNKIRGANNPETNRFTWYALPSTLEQSRCILHFIDGEMRIKL